MPFPPVRATDPWLTDSLSGGSDGAANSVSVNVNQERCPGDAADQQTGSTGTTTGSVTSGQSGDWCRVIWILLGLPLVTTKVRR